MQATSCSMRPGGYRSFTFRLPAHLPTAHIAVAVRRGRRVGAEHEVLDALRRALRELVALALAVTDGYPHRTTMKEEERRRERQRGVGDAARRHYARYR